MPIETPNLLIPKPIGTEVVSLESLNNIFDIIDEAVATRKELGETAEKVSEHETRIQAVETQLKEEAPTPITMKRGLQVVDVPQDTSFNVKGIRGRTLINLLGRDGNCEDESKFPARVASAVIKRTDIKSIGSSSLLVVATGTANTEHYADSNGFILNAGKFYVAIADTTVINNAAIPMIRVYGQSLKTFDVGKRAVRKADGVFIPVFVKFSPTADDFGVVRLQVCNGAGSTSYTQNGEAALFDAVRVYEISKAEYDAINTMTPEQLATKYPYVDDVKPIRNPYVIRYGQNLLPPFTEWINSDISQISITDAYSANLSFSNIGNPYLQYHVPAIEGQTYTLSYSGQPVPYLIYCDKDRNRISPVTAYRGASPFTFTVPTGIGAVYIEVVLKALDIDGQWIKPDGTKYLSANVMLNIGTQALPFEPRNDDYMFLETSLHSNIDGAVRDRVFMRDGKPYKLKWFEEVVLDGSLTWSFGWDGNGYKIITVDPKTALWNVQTGTQRSLTVTKYDGKILKSVPEPESPTPDICWFGNGNSSIVDITVADIDSGWGENYTPTQAEIQAYFNGYQMGTTNGTTFTPGYNGTGTKAWRNIVGDTGSGSTTLPTVASLTGYTPYKLLYQRSQAIEEPIQVEGSVSLKSGTNVLEIGEGVVIRETPVFNTGTEDANYVYINDTDAPLKQRTDKILTVYKGVDNDTNWKAINRTVGGLPYNIAGLQYAQIPISQFDRYAAYSVTYTVLDRHTFTVPLDTITGEYRTNIGGVVAELSQDMADIAVRISIVENTKASKQPYPVVKAVLNGGFTVYGIGINDITYQKTDSNAVLLTGAVVPTLNTPGTRIYRLPEGFRPKGRRIVLPSMQYLDMAIFRPVDFIVETNGWVCIGDNWLTGGWALLAGMFIAEQ